MSSIPTPPYYNKILSFQEDIIPFYGRDIDAESLPFDTTMGFEPVSPNLHPNDPSSWLDNIPVIGEDKRGAAPNTQRKRSIPMEKKSVLLASIVDYQETSFLHVRRSIEWYLDNGPAPSTLSERWKKPDTDKETIYFLIIFQSIYYGEDSLSPWQTNYLFRLHGLMLDRPKCPFCGSVVFSWCNEVVPRC